MWCMWRTQVISQVISEVISGLQRSGWVISEVIYFLTLLSPLALRRHTKKDKSLDNFLEHKTVPKSYLRLVKSYVFSEQVIHLLVKSYVFSNSQQTLLYFGHTRQDPKLSLLVKSYVFSDKVINLLVKSYVFSNPRIISGLKRKDNSENSNGVRLRHAWSYLFQ